MKTAEAAIGKWHSILPALGIDPSFLQDKHGPCPVCNGNDRFRFDNKDGRGTYYCNHCGAGDGIRLAMEYTGLAFPDLARKIDVISGNIQAMPQAQKQKVDPSKRLKKIASELKPLADESPVFKYLKNRNLPENSALRYHPSMKYFEAGNLVGEFPSMVALFKSSQGKPLTYHITHLDSEGWKAGVLNVKKIMPPVGELAGGAIRLSEVSRHIGIAEGIETALAVSSRFNVPCWASCNANLLEKFVPPEGVEEVSIFADNDKNYAGQKAAYSLANRLMIKNVKSTVYVPTVVGTDFADKVS